jgi:hypothetical protein
MTTTARPRHAYVHVIDLDDTVTLQIPDETTKRITPPHRRPDANPTRFEDRRSFAGTDYVTGEIPLLGVPDRDLEQERFNRFYASTDYVGRHHRPGLFARLRAAFRSFR